MAAETLRAVGPEIKAGMTTRQIDDLVYEFITSPGGLPRAAALPGLPGQRLHLDQPSGLPRHPG
jgi:hypothetical protein